LSKLCRKQEILPRPKYKRRLKSKTHREEGQIETIGVFEVALG